MTSMSRQDRRADLYGILTIYAIGVGNMGPATIENRAYRERLRNAVIDDILALDEPEGLSEWQPIETVPKDGTPVDLWSALGRHVNMRWLTGAEVGPEDYGPGGKHEHLAMTGWRSPAMMTPADGNGILNEEQFTHWMPLPAPPDLQSRGSAEAQGEVG